MSICPVERLKTDTLQGNVAEADKAPAFSSRDI